MKLLETMVYINLYVENNKIMYVILENIISYLNSRLLESGK